MVLYPPPPGCHSKKCWLRKLQELFNAAGLPPAFSCTGCENSLRNVLIIITTQVVEARGEERQKEK